MSGFAKNIVRRLVGVRAPQDYIREMIQLGDCQTALDIGCGKNSVLSQFRPALRTTGLDAAQDMLDHCRSTGAHDDFILADISKLEPQSILEHNQGRLFDLVVFLDLIEHLPKRSGFELLEKCEQLTSKYILLATPNGFLEQGPEFGNKYQRHLSGWFPHDFQGLGYTVYGTFGTRLLRGYAGRPRYDFPFVNQCDWLLGGLLRTEKHPARAFGLVAIKDVRGVPARLG